ncbi:competence protein ComEA helix-hairpin-helix repeat region [Pragia fontium]|uniref:ComEA family DNA-binding protein n=1 Tax=Pragia fontium TaxID=82985 RepID=UPI000E05999E|nr:helix-hairpin-helix domain-containing protein [Pragia fontium]SUB83134.1 competence protein ComEA helix-hairpin-helix repeat region [Pragia fontium]
MKKSVMKLHHMLFISALLLPAVSNAAPEQGSVQETAPVASIQSSSTAKEVLEPQVSLNQATAEQLAEVMLGIGIKKAQNIVNYREQHGPFASLEQLQEVPGIGIATVERNLSRLKL